MPQYLGGGKQFGRQAIWQVNTTRQGPSAEVETAWFAFWLDDEEEQQDEDVVGQWWNEPVVAVLIFQPAWPDEDEEEAEQDWLTQWWDEPITTVTVVFNPWLEDEDEIVEEEPVPSYFLDEVGFPFHGYALDEELDPESDEEYLQPLIFEEAPFHFYFLEDEAAEDEDEVLLPGWVDVVLLPTDVFWYWPEVEEGDADVPLDNADLFDVGSMGWSGAFQCGAFQAGSFQLLCPIDPGTAQGYFVGFINNVGFLRS